VHLLFVPLLLGSVARSKVLNLKFSLTATTYSQTVQIQVAKDLSKYDTEFDLISDGQLAKLSGHVRRLINSIHPGEWLTESVYIFSWDCINFGKLSRQDGT
jgi:hypothetical protein